MSELNDIVEVIHIHGQASVDRRSVCELFPTDFFVTRKVTQYLHHDGQWYPMAGHDGFWPTREAAQAALDAVKE